MLKSFFDSEFLEHKRRYVFQCAGAAVCMMCVLRLLSSISNTAVTASLGASTFIVFALPHMESARPRFLIGGYVSGIFCAIICCLIADIAISFEVPFILEHEPTILGSMAVALAMFIMVVTNTEHPPAAGLALGMVFDGCRPHTIVVVMLGIMCLSLVHRVFKKFMINLL